MFIIRVKYQVRRKRDAVDYSLLKRDCKTKKLKQNLNLRFIC